jgi:hypothetical protein
MYTEKKDKKEMCKFPQLICVCVCVCVYMCIFAMSNQFEDI